MKFTFKSTIFFLLMTALFSQSTLTNVDLDNIREQLESNIIEPQDIQSEDLLLKEIVLTSDVKNTKEDRYFGYSYFKRAINFFDNVPTPSDFKLGPGDEITLSMWGETNLREDFVINKSGLIYYKNIGFINLSNKTVKEAESLLLEELSSIYSTLKDNDNQTSLMLEVGKLKAINVYFSGQIESPGIALIHPFSDIFSAIVQAGGIKNEGSLRKVQLIRNGQVISSVDFYSFFTSGKNNFSSTRILEGDIIHVPVVSKRIEISGEVITNGYFEVLAEESLNNIIASYAGGYKSTAGSSLILDQIIPLSERISDDDARSSKIVPIDDIVDVKINNGDSIQILSITDVDTDVEIYGRVKSPGLYPAKQTLRKVLDLAGGFRDKEFRKTILDNKIVILRKDKEEFYGITFILNYKEANTFELKVGDKIFIYEDTNYNNNFTYRVEGEVFKPGTYPLRKSKITVREALSLAGGLTELSTERNITVKQEFTDVNDEGIEITTSESVNNVTLDFEIGINSVLIASPFENVVKVEGSVYNPGLITFTKGYKYPRYIELAGGYKSDSLKRKTYIKRANGNIEKVNGFFVSRGKRVYPGDTIVVPTNPDPNDFDVTAFTADILSMLSNIAAILIIVDRQ